MFNLPTILKHYIPNLDLSDIKVRDKGNGEYIDFWGSDEPQPSPEKIKMMHDEWHGSVNIQAQLSTDKKADEIRFECAERLGDATGLYIIGERETWPTQEREAISWLLDNTTPTPLLSSISLARGIELSVLIKKIMKNAHTYKGNIGIILGKQQKLLDALYNLDESDPNIITKINQIKWD